jgi:hypothetical protein
VGYPALLRLSRSRLHKILRQGELRPHKIRYYVEKRDSDFETKMANLLHVYQEVEMVNEYRRGEAGRQVGMVTIWYDEKLGIQALAPHDARSAAGGGDAPQSPPGLRIRAHGWGLAISWTGFAQRESD